MAGGKDSEYSLLQRIYNRIVRPRLPYKISVHNGVPVKGVIRLFDRTEVFPRYEEALIAALRRQTRRGDEVVVVGGGMGVSTVAAARATGPAGPVHSFEANIDRFEEMRTTVRINCVDDQISLVHGVVGPFAEYSEDKYGGPDGAEVVDPSDLPECDVLELDCEGAELSIIDGMEIEPRTIVVETHGFLDAPPADVKDALTTAGYSLVDEAVEDAENEIHVLTAVSD